MKPAQTCVFYLLACMHTNIPRGTTMASAPITAPFSRAFAERKSAVLRRRRVQMLTPLSLSLSAQVKYCVAKLFEGDVKFATGTLLAANPNPTQRSHTSTRTRCVKRFIAVDSRDGMQHVGGASDFHLLFSNASLLCDPQSSTTFEGFLMCCTNRFLQCPESKRVNPPPSSSQPLTTRRRSRGRLTHWCSHRGGGARAKRRVHCGRTC